MNPRVHVQESEPVSDHDRGADCPVAPPVGQSENLNILPGGYFARLLRTTEDSDA